MLRKTWPLGGGGAKEQKRGHQVVVALKNKTWPPGGGGAKEQKILLALKSKNIFWR